MEEKANSRSLIFLEAALVLLFASVLLPSNVKSIAIALFALISVIHFFKSKNTFNFPFFIVNSLVFIVIGVTLIYSDDKAFGLNRLVRLLSLVIFPFCFALYDREDIRHIQNHIKKYLSIYLISVVVFNVLPFLWFYTTHYSFNDMLIHFPTVMNINVGKYNIHPIYAAMHCSVAILFSVYILRSLKTRWKIIGVLFLNLILVLFLFLYAKKGPLLALVLVSILLILFERKKTSVKPFIFIVVGLIVLMAALPHTRNKFLEFEKIENIEKGMPTSTNIRYTIYGIAKNVILNSPIIGYGIGDYRKVLSDKYDTLDIKILKESRYNTHNQFLSLLIIGGIIALLAFLFTLVINIIFAIRFNNELLLLVIAFYGIVMLTDNVLEKESGVIYFSLFFNFLSSKSLFTQVKND